MSPMLTKTKDTVWTAEKCKQPAIGCFRPSSSRRECYQEQVIIELSDSRRPQPLQILKAHLNSLGLKKWIRGDDSCRTNDKCSGVGKARQREAASGASRMALDIRIAGRCGLSASACQAGFLPLGARAGCRNTLPSAVASRARYRLGRKIGGGSFGDIYLGE
eukprot:1140361-Pelagomonas_calceolata.AAC.5